MRDSREWEVVRAVDISPGRRRLEYVFGDGSKRHAVIDADADTPDIRRRTAEALLSETIRLHRPDGPRTARIGDIPPSLGG